jgi:hypothetical protein
MKNFVPEFERESSSYRIQKQAAMGRKWIQVQRGVLYSGCRVFNNLPVQIKSHFENLRNFKKILKNYLIEHFLYSLEEYYHLAA